MKKVKAAILGPGNIGTDLLLKIRKGSRNIEVALFAGIVEGGRGLELARKMGVPTSTKGVEAILADDSIKIVFEATGARAHLENAPKYRKAGKIAIDLTPAAVGPYLVPAINMDTNLDGDNFNMVTCGGQATIPMVAAVNQVTPVDYAEIVATISSKSAGPGTRANIDEFTETTSKAIEILGGAEHGKAIIILNPAEPPLIMRDTVFTLSQGGSREDIEQSIHEMVAAVQKYVPGYRLKQKVQFENIGDNAPVRIPGVGLCSGLKTTIMLEVEGAAHYLPAYAGNLDIMTSAALVSADHWAAKQVTKEFA